MYMPGMICNILLCSDNYSTAMFGFLSVAQFSAPVLYSLFTVPVVVAKTNIIWRLRRLFQVIIARQSHHKVVYMAIRLSVSMHFSMKLFTISMTKSTLNHSASSVLTLSL